MTSYRQLLHCADVGSLLILILYLFLALVCPLCTNKPSRLDSFISPPRADVAQSVSTIPSAWLLNNNSAVQKASIHRVATGLCRSKSLISKVYSALILIIMLSGDVEVNPGPIKLAQFNAQSVNASAGHDKPLIISQFITDNCIDILGLSETWLRTDTLQCTLNSLAPVGYSIFHRPRDSRGGGVAFIFKSSLSFSEVTLPIFPSFESIGGRLTVDNKSFIFINLYRPPSLSTNDFLSDFSNLLEDFGTAYSNLFITGDFNLRIDTTEPSVHSFTTLIDTFSLSQLVDFPTHIAGHTLDLILCRRDAFHVSDLEAVVLPFSDHFAVLNIIHITKNCRPHKTYKSFRNFKAFNATAFTHDVLSSGLNYIKDIPACRSLCKYVRLNYK